MRGRMGGMKYRKLRIEWSVACVVACTLTVAFWVRSYRTVDIVCCHIPFANLVAVDSLFGELHIASDYTKPSSPWKWDSESLVNENRARAYRDDPMNESPNRIGLGFTHPRTYTIFSTPYWLLALLASLFGIVPWMRYIKWRFTLRMLLFATTLVGLTLGVYVYFSTKTPGSTKPPISPPSNNPLWPTTPPIAR